MKTDKTLILNRLKSHYCFKKDSDFARFLEVKPQTLASWYARNTFDIDILYTKCVEISPDYLLSGKGDILRNAAEAKAPLVDKLDEIQKQLDFKTEQVNFYQEKSIDLAKKLEDCENEKKPTRTIV